MTAVARIQTLERTTAALVERVEALEATKPGVTPASIAMGAGAAPAKAVLASDVAPVVEQRPVAQPPRVRPRPRRTVAFEDVLGAQVLAWVGGLAALLGLAFFFALAVSSGWLDEATRTALGAGLSVGLIGVGLRAQERRRAAAARAAAGAGLGGLFLAVAAATRAYELVAVVPGAALALAVGTLAMVLAVRWRSQSIAALGVVGGLLAPVLTGADLDVASLALVWVAGLSAAGVLVWQRWAWLGTVTFLLTTGQWIVFLLDDPSTTATVVVLGAFALLNVLVAIGFDVRRRRSAVQRSAVALVTANALAVGLAGGLVLGVGWVAALAIVHLVAGLVVLRSRRASHELGVLALALAVVLSDVAFGVVADGPIVVVGWAASAVGFGLLRRTLDRRGLDDAVLQLGLGAHVALAIAHTLLHDAPPGDVSDLGAGALALSALATACLVAARTVGHRTGLRLALDAVGLAAVAYCTALVTPAPFLALAWAVEALALARLARSADDPVARLAAGVHLGAAAVVALAIVAPPAVLVDGLRHPVLALMALGAVGGAMLGVALLGEDGRRRRLLLGTAALTGAYAIGALVVTPFADGSAAGQVALSLLWATGGVVALGIGLMRDVDGLRRGGLAFLLLVSAKVFLYDLSTLDSLYRVGSFVALGILLLATAAGWQRLRPDSARSPHDAAAVSA